MKEKDLEYIKAGLDSIVGEIQKLKSENSVKEEKVEKDSFEFKEMSDDCCIKVTPENCELRGTKAEIMTLLTAIISNLVKDKDIDIKEKDIKFCASLGIANADENKSAMLDALADSLIETLKNKFDK